MRAEMSLERDRARETVYRKKNGGRKGKSVVTRRIVVRKKRERETGCRGSQVKGTERSRRRFRLGGKKSASRWFGQSRPGGRACWRPGSCGRAGRRPFRCGGWWSGSGSRRACRWSGWRFRLRPAWGLKDARKRKEWGGGERKRVRVR
jgi:hypothetical protein